MKESWITDNLSNCIKLKSGYNLTAKNMIEGDFPVFGGNGIAGYHNEFNLSGEHIIIGRVGALCGNSRYITEKLWLTDNAFKVSEFKYDFDLKFLNYLLNFKNLRSYARQAAQPVISNSSLKDIILSFPKSTSEQKQIVDILDTAFEALEKAKTNLEKNLANTKELFDSKLNEIFSQKGEGWEKKSWNDILEIRSGRNQKDVINIDGKYPILGSAGKIMGYADKYICEEGTTIIGRKGTINKPLKIDTKFWNVDTAFGLHALDKLDKNYLFYFCKNFNFTELDKGSGRPSLVKSDLLKIKLFLPSLEIQEEIVIKLDILKSKTKQLEQKYQQKLDNIEELKKSLLQKAFSGELRK